MNIKTFFGGVIGIAMVSDRPLAIALLIGIILIQRLDQVYKGEPNSPALFLIFISGAGAVTGGTLASPMEVIDD